MTAHARLCSNRRPGKSLTAKKKTSSSTTRARRVAARATAETKPKGKVAVFVSGGGSNLRALHAAMEDGRVNAQVAVVVSNIPSCGGVEWSKERGIPTLTYPPKKGEGASIARATHTHQSTTPSVYSFIRTPVSPVHAAKAKVHEAIKAIKPSAIYKQFLSTDPLSKPFNPTHRGSHAGRPRR